MGPSVDSLRKTQQPENKISFSESTQERLRGRCFWVNLSLDGSSDSESDWRLHSIVG